MLKLIVTMFFCLTIGIPTHIAELKMREFMSTQDLTLWQLIDLLGRHPSLAPNKIKKILPIDFSERRRSNHSSFYDGGQLILADQVNIKAVYLRVRHEDEGRGRVSLYLGGSCVTIEQIYAHYSEVIIVEAPRGHSLDEETYWRIQQPWGRLSFGFKERNPRCLASVVINRIDVMQH